MFHGRFIESYSMDESCSSYYDDEDASEFQEIVEIEDQILRLNELLGGDERSMFEDLRNFK